MDIVTYPDPVLKRKAELVENIDGDVQRLIDNMSTLMYQSSGIGLAANQVGIEKRIIIFDIDYKEKGKDLTVLINPEILFAEDKIEFEEGCLSVPDFQGKITRKKYIQIKGLDRDGKPVNIETENLTAICIQHEIDHLNGTLILDHVSHLKRNIYRRKIEKLMKKEE
ncbi:MAG: peptide deformylase [Thermodesulfobacteriota bacterium]